MLDKLHEGRSCCPRERCKDALKRLCVTRINRGPEDVGTALAVDSQVGMGSEKRSGKRRRCRLVILVDTVEQIVVILHQHPIDRPGCTQGRNRRFVVGCEDGTVAALDGRGAIVRLGRITGRPTHMQTLETAAGPLAVLATDRGEVRGFRIGE